MISKEIQDTVILCLAVLGAFLGIVNTITLWRERRVRLRVNGTIEGWGAALGVPSTQLVLEIENRSTFPVTIKDAGIDFEKPGAPSVEFSQTVERKDSEGEDETLTTLLPIRIAARSHLVLHSNDLDTSLQAYSPPMCLYQNCLRHNQEDQ